MEIDTRRQPSRRSRPAAAMMITFVLVGGMLAPGAAGADGAVVRIDALHLVPVVVEIAVGQTVTFHWEPDETLVETSGPVTLVADDGSFRSPPIDPGDTWRIRFERTGLHDYHIEQNPSVEGRIVVE